MKKHKKKINGFESTFIIGDLNEFYNETVKPMLPAIRRIFNEEGIIVPDDPGQAWDLLSLALPRSFDFDSMRLTANDFREVSKKMELELRKSIREDRLTLEKKAKSFHEQNATPLVRKWIEKGKLSQVQKRDCVLEIADKKDITHEEAFDFANENGIDFGNMNQFGSWKRNNTRLKNKSK